MSSIPPWFKLPAHAPLVPISSNTTTSTVIIGGGLAGCHTAYELATRGINVKLIDASDTIAGGASGNSAGIVKPFVTRSPGRSDQFYKIAFDFALARFKTNERLRIAAQFTQCGVLQLCERDYPNNNAYITCSANEATDLAGARINSPAVFFPRAGWLNPATLCQALVQNRNIEVRLQHKVRSINRNNNVWEVVYENASRDNTNNDTVKRIECSTLIIANGSGANRFSPTQELPITAVRGQTSRFALTDGAELKTVVAGKRYAIPDGNHIVVGASFIRGQESTQLIDDEHEENLAGLSTLLPTLSIDSIAESGFCAIRATTPDRLPIAGPMPSLPSYSHDYERLRDGLAPDQFPNASYEQSLFVIGGFGSRGIVSAPYCAKLLADYLCGSTDQEKSFNADDSDSLSSWFDLLHPGRFKVRKLRRSRGLLQR